MPERISTGVHNLDNVLNGGFPGRYSYLLHGEPGTGKTTFALQFLLEGVKNGESVVFVSLSQTRHELEMIADSHGWDISKIHVVEMKTGEPETEEQTVFYPVDIRMDLTRDAIMKALDTHKPRRLVYDSLVEVRKLSRDPTRFQREMLSLKQTTSEMGVATLLIDLTTDDSNDLELESYAHGIIHLDKDLPTYGQARRRIEVAKMRGVDFFDGYHDMDILQGKGVVAFPRIVPLLAPEEAGGNLISSGVRPLDEMLGGGLESGTTALVIGQAGTGKSTLASLYLHAALSRGEACAMFLFEERQETFFRRSEGLGLPLRSFHKQGLLEIYDFNPSEISQGEFNEIALRSVDENNTKVVVIDSFTGYVGGLPNSNEAIVQIQLLLKYLARRDVLTVLIVSQSGLLGHQMSMTLDVSFLGDTVLFLRMYEAGSTIERSITVAKKRHGPHDLNIRRLEIGKKGVAVLGQTAPETAVRLLGQS
ncbi:ATPase domain-containing protein [Parvularcula dongshanensis]|uniref:Circadian clock protein KaiC n=1 Tax=Parvularcula dongshanensis TaxID=1173995 RepID=A0A840I319_9PROT|nr:ATPase domain-containing protein [Parvularcula dongshanensis]MBB4658692.1 circadian clock protein KaiC [Parvularcula dongshanensis]